MSLADDIRQFAPHITAPPWKVHEKPRNARIEVDREYGGAVVAECSWAAPKGNAHFLTLLGNHASRIANLIQSAARFELFVRGQYGPPSEGPEADVMDRAHIALLNDLAAVRATTADRPRTTVLTLYWKDEVSREEAHRLSRSWAAKISEKTDVLAEVRMQILADERTTESAA